MTNKKEELLKLAISPQSKEDVCEVMGKAFWNYGDDWWQENKEWISEDIWEMLKSYGYKIQLVKI